MKLGRDFVLFSCVGATGTLLHYAVLVLLTGFLQMNAVVGSSVGAIVGAVVNYLLNYRFTFRACEAHRSAVPRYVAAAILAFAANAACMAFFISEMRLHYLPAQIASTVIVLFSNFLVNRFWVFRERIV